MIVHLLTALTICCPTGTHISYTTSWVKIIPVHTVIAHDTLRQILSVAVKLSSYCKLLCFANKYILFNLCATSASTGSIYLSFVILTLTCETFCIQCDYQRILTKREKYLYNFRRENFLNLYFVAKVFYYMVTTDINVHSGNASK